MNNSDSKIHTPVLEEEVIDYLKPKSDKNYIDCTLGWAGHTLKILEKNGPNGKVLGLDADSAIQDEARKIIENAEYGERVVLVNKNFSNLKNIAQSQKFFPVSGILFDLGFSSWHLEKSGRGFSFQRDEDLDMRYDLQSSLKASDIVNYWSLSEIERILKEYGEESWARKISLSIIEARKKENIQTTGQLVRMIQRTIPFKRGKIHTATKTFQALRIAVNDELNNLSKALFQAVEILEPGGRLAVISFHSLEDRIVKRFLKQKASENLINILTKKPVGPLREEIRRNPRARSAKLRAAEKI